MGGRTVSPGGALLRSSRMFSVPKPLPDPPSASFNFGEQQSPTMTKPYPQHQTITSPLASREKGDWGVKRPLPLKTTLATTTPLIRFKQIDTVENVTDFNSAADHTLSLEKFQELRVAMSVPVRDDGSRGGSARKEVGLKSVFEEDMDVTDHQSGKDDQRWKFKGPWLARMTEGEFINYLNKQVRPKRAEFRALLKEKLAEDLTVRQNSAALEAGKPPPPRLQVQDVTESQFSDYIRSLRNDRVSLYAVVSKFLDLAPLGKPIGITQSSMFFMDEKKVAESAYGKSGPPPSHPSAGISYLRTNSFMENHPVYGPQAKKSPTLSRIVYPRAGPTPAKLGVGGFVATVPSGDNDFNVRPIRAKTSGKKPLSGIQHLDIASYGGAKAYVEPHTASVDPDGKVVLQVRETSAEAQVVAKELKGQAKVYNNASLKRSIPQPQQEEHPSFEANQSVEASRLDTLANEVLSEGKPVTEQQIVGSSSSYGLKPPT